MRAELLLPMVLAGAAAGDNRTDRGGVDERVLGVYIFHRHGDRTAKAWKPVNLTAFGALQVQSSGAAYRARYVRPGAGAGPSAQTWPCPRSWPCRRPPTRCCTRRPSPSCRACTRPWPRPRRRSPTAPASPRPSAATSTSPSTPSATAPALPARRTWPGSRAAAAASTPRSAPTATSPRLPTATRTTARLTSTAAWCPSLTPPSTRTPSPSRTATAIGSPSSPLPLGAWSLRRLLTVSLLAPVFDLINVATVHNASIASSSLLDPSVLARLHSLASVHEWNLAYNASEPVRAVAGAVLAGQVVDALQAIVDAKPTAPRLHAQFGAYGTFMAFFGLAQLPAVGSDFYGICDYASSMAFELVTNVPAGARLRADDVAVRFLFANGTAAENRLEAYPLIGQDQLVLPWPAFKAAMSKFAVVSSKHWCELCGNTDKCTSSTPAAIDGNASSRASRDGGVSRPVAGVIGALVTLVVILGVQAAVMLFGGLSLIKKSTLAGTHRTSVRVEAADAKSGATFAPHR